MDCRKVVTLPLPAHTTTALFKVRNQETFLRQHARDSCSGAEGFCDGLFDALRIPYEPIRWANGLTLHVMQESY